MSTQPVPGGTAAQLRETLLAALGLALAAAVSLGLARFSYALLLPPMRAALDWSYFTAGLMNTVNAAGYLVGALLAPKALAAFDARRLLLGGGLACALLLALHGAVDSEAALLALRFATGVASAASFIAGGLLAARLASRSGTLGGGLVLGLYYGGTGGGIIAASLLVPLLSDAGATARWQPAWWALGAAACAATLGTLATTGSLRAPPPARASAPVIGAAWRPLSAALAAYLLFGLGYIGYMTFIVTLLREQGMRSGTITLFYALLGVGVIASSWLWADLLQRHRSGRPLALLNALLAGATALPVLASGSIPALFASAALFGAVFLSVVASTTALVRHNLPVDDWPAGIAAFTIVFAAGQIAGPGLVGAIADGKGGLEAGLLVSAAVLALGSALAATQRALPR